MMSAGDQRRIQAQHAILVVQEYQIILIGAGARLPVYFGVYAGDPGSSWAKLERRTESIAVVAAVVASNLQGGPVRRREILQNIFDLNRLFM